MNERVKELRKSLNLTLDKFGDRLGIQKSAISKIERGENALTEQNAKAICREFQVNYDWLMNGTGEMFLNSDDAFRKRLEVIMAKENDFHKNLITALVDASEEDVAAIKKVFDSVYEASKSSNSLYDSAPDTEEELEAQLSINNKGADAV